MMPMYGEWSHLSSDLREIYLHHLQRWQDTCLTFDPFFQLLSLGLTFMEEGIIENFS